MKRILILGFAMLVTILGLAGAKAIRERDRQADEIETLSASLDRARAAVDSCGATLARERDAFLGFDSRVDSLRRVTERYVDSSQGGVPQARYRDYLTAFETYNDSVDAWQPRVDSLRATEARCRALIELHNQLSDSVRVRMEALTGSRREGAAGPGLPADSSPERLPGGL